MITLIKEIPDLDVQSASYTKICCGLAAYAEYEKIALFWKQTDENGSITALISLVDNVMTLYNKDANTDELSEFLKCISPKGVFTDIKTAELLSLKIETECDTLVVRPPYCLKDVANDFNLGLDFAVDTVASRLNIGDKTVFKADLSHRIRHNCATFVTTPDSAAFALYSKNFAIISGIAVNENTEKSGVGSSTLKRLLLSVGNRPMLVCSEYKNTPFYLKNGFTLLERCAYCRI